MDFGFTHLVIHKEDSEVCCTFSKRLVSWFSDWGINGPTIWLGVWRLSNRRLIVKYPTSLALSRSMVTTSQGFSPQLVVTEAANHYIKTQSVKKWHRDYPFTLVSPDHGYSVCKSGGRKSVNNKRYLSGPSRDITSVVSLLCVNCDNTLVIFKNLILRASFYNIMKSQYLKFTTAVNFYDSCTTIE